MMSSPARLPLGRVLISIAFICAGVVAGPPTAVGASTSRRSAVHAYDQQSAATTASVGMSRAAARVYDPTVELSGRTVVVARGSSAAEDGSSLLSRAWTAFKDERGSIGGYPGELGQAIARGGRFSDPVTAFKQLGAKYGIDTRVLSERFHVIKPGGGAGAADNTLIDLTGNVYDTTTGERLGQVIVRQGG